jgi:hypothetical protein
MSRALLSFAILVGSPLLLDLLPYADRSRPAPRAAQSGAR